MVGPTVDPVLERAHSLRWCAMLTVLLFVGVVIHVTASPSTAQIKSDFGIYPEPPLQALPHAGATIVDPVFGTRILRLTDGADGNTVAGTAYSYWPTFNKDNSYVVVNEMLKISRAKFFRFSPGTLTVDSGFLLASPPPGLQEYALTWSGIYPNVTFGVGGHKIWQVDVSTQQATLVKDLTEYGAGGHLTQMLKSLNDDVFALSIVDGSRATVGYVVYQRSTDKILLRTLVGNVDEVQVDKSGRYLVVVFNDGTDDIFDLTTSPPRLVAHLTGSSGFWHRDCGVGTLFSHINNALAYRQLATPMTILPLIPGFWSYATQQDHFSMLADDDTWAMASRYSINAGPVQGAFDNEIVRVATDGSNRVQRIAHHRSVGGSNYAAMPKASISRDGNFIAFTSNWGNPTGRIDVYIVETRLTSNNDRTPPAAPQNVVVK